MFSHIHRIAQEGFFAKIGDWNAAKRAYDKEIRKVCPKNNYECPSETRILILLNAFYETDEFKGLLADAHEKSDRKITAQSMDAFKEGMATLNKLGEIADGLMAIDDEIKHYDPPASSTVPKIKKISAKLSVYGKTAKKLTPPTKEKTLSELGYINVDDILDVFKEFGQWKFFERQAAMDKGYDGDSIADLISTADLDPDSLNDDEATNVKAYDQYIADPLTQIELLIEAMVKTQIRIGLAMLETLGVRNDTLSRLKINEQYPR